MQNRTNFAQICLVISYLSILKAAAVKGIQNRSDWTDEVSDSSTRIHAKYLKLREILKMTPVFM